MKEKIVFGQRIPNNAARKQQHSNSEVVWIEFEILT